MTVPNIPWGTPPEDLPQGVVAPSQLGGATQDHTKAKYRGQAASRFPNQVNDTLAGNPANVSGPLGVIVNMAAGLTEEVANADPATIKKPSDLVPRTNPFFSGLPVSRLLWDTIEAIITGVVNGWSGGSGTVSDPQQVQYTIEAIADAVINGYTVETKVTSGTWTKPANITELVVIVIGGGENGENGKGVNSVVAKGGRGGGFIAQQIDPATVSASTSYVVGAHNSASSFGTHVTSAPGSGGISTAFGFTPTTSLPGDGGAGGRGATSDISATSGSSGMASALAAGGAGGASGDDVPGSAGANVSAASSTKCGGGGGGGGGGAVFNSASRRDGGPGGPGGYPGGGGGGGGGANSSTFGASNNGAGGIGATGILWIFWR